MKENYFIKEYGLGEAVELVNSVKFVVKIKDIVCDRVNKHSGTSHQYKIGQKVKSIKNGQEYYIVGVKGKSIRDYELDNTMLIVHFEKDKPSRFGFAVRPCQVEVVVSWQDYYN